MKHSGTCSDGGVHTWHGLQLRADFGNATSFVVVKRCLHHVSPEDPGHSKEPLHRFMLLLPNMMSSSCTIRRFVAEGLGQ